MQTLANHPIIDTERQRIQAIAEALMSKILISKTTSLDIITKLASSIEYQSTPELVDTWIAHIAKDEWQKLRIARYQDIDIDIRIEALGLRKQILSACDAILKRALAYPTLIEQISQKVRLIETSVDELSPERQDRIIAREMQLGLPDWNSIMGLISTHEELYKPFLQAKTMDIEYADIEENSLILKISAPIMTDPNITGLTIHDAVSREWQQLSTNEFIHIQKSASILQIQRDALSRYHSILGDKNVLSQIRARYHTIPVYKKRSFGDKTPPKEKEAGKLAWQG